MNFDFTTYVLRMQQNNCGASPLIKGISTVPKSPWGDLTLTLINIFLYIYIDIPRGEEIIESSVFKNDTEKGTRPKSSSASNYAAKPHKMSYTQQRFRRILEKIY